MKKVFLLPILPIVASVFCWMLFAAGSEKVPSRAYAGHESDRDIQNFVRQYPKAAGTRLDDCQTCHRSGVAETDTAREYSPCGYCHLLQYPNAKYKTGVPGKFEDTLNPYGLAYKRAGRNGAALASIENDDSDGDTFSNAKEIAELRYPGDSASRPGQPLAPVVTLKFSDIQELPRQAQFMLMNASSEPFDEYVDYAGVRVKDLLDAAHVDLSGATGITVFAPDGYNINYTIEDVNNAFPRQMFYSAPGDIKEEERKFVHYPKDIPATTLVVLLGGVLSGGGEITLPWLLLAYERNGKPLDVAQYEKGTGRLKGEGPYRLVIPQRNAKGDPSKPGRPDRSVKSKVYGDGWDFDKDLDHNAGSCIRGATVIRINPMPVGFEEYDWKNGWPLVTTRQIAIFGKGVPKK
jgi:hypothetical protein